MGVEEFPRGPHSITGVSTSITAVVGRTLRGPTDEPVIVTGFADFQRQFGGLWNGSALGFSVRDFFMNGGSTAVVVRLFNGSHAANTAAVVRDSITVSAIDPGAWGSQLRIRVDHATREPDPTLGEQATSLFNLFVRDGSTGQIEEHWNVTVSIADHPRHLRDVLRGESRLIRLRTPAATDGPTARPDAHGDPAPETGTDWDGDATSTGVSGAGGNAGGPGAALTVADFTGGTTHADSKGLYALDRADLFNLLVIPPYSPTGDVDAPLVSEAHTYCVSRRALLVVDGLSSWDAAEVVSGVDIKAAVGSIGTNAALYFPRLRLPNPIDDDQVQTFSAAGSVAGVIARTDAQRGVWKAPAGLDATLSGGSELSVPLTDAEIGQLNPIGVNCLRTAPSGLGVVWGARTAAGSDALASDWKYLPVRRTALFIEESLHRGTQWVLFEPNDEPLWAQIRIEVGTFMSTLFRQGAFSGATPRDAYFVRCDQETTTQADIDRGIVTIDVGFAPLKPAEFVVLRIQQLTGQSTRLGEIESPRFTATPQRVDPYKNFPFRVKWEGRYVAGISKVSGLKRSPRMTQDRGGGGSITLERGVTHDAEFATWAGQRWSAGSGPGSGEAVQAARKDLVVEHYDEAGRFVLAYRVFRAGVSDFQSLPDLDENANAVAIQNLTLENDGWERDGDTVEPADPSFDEPD